jgi:hypothetical protein
MTADMAAIRIRSSRRFGIDIGTAFCSVQVVAAWVLAMLIVFTSGRSTSKNVAVTSVGRK